MGKYKFTSNMNELSGFESISMKPKEVIILWAVLGIISVVIFFSIIGFVCLLT